MITRRQIAELKQLAIEEGDRRLEANLNLIGDARDFLSDEKFAAFMDDWYWMAERSRRAAAPNLTATKSSDKPIPDNRWCATRRRPKQPR